MGAHQFGRAPALPSPAPLDLALAVIPTLPRPGLACLVARAIDRLDEIDGDPDFELNGDEMDSSVSEDDPLFRGELPQPYGMGPGCPISDPDFGVEESGEPEYVR